MKCRFLFVLLVGLTLVTVAQENSFRSVATNEAICGFIAGPSFYSEAANVKQGLAVDLFVGDVRVGQPTKLRFYINQKPGGQPVDNVQIEHEKFIHVIGVREDLSEFFHIHPLKVAPGMWVGTHVFTNGGSYKLWADVKWRGAAYSFGQPMLSVSGRMDATGARRDPDNQALVSGYLVSLNHPVPLLTGSTNLLEFRINDSSGTAVTTENYLGAPMHVVIVREDLSVFLHAHPESKAASDPVIRFRQSFAQPGIYKVFAQFRLWKSKLPPGEALLAEFYVTVSPDSATGRRP